MPKLAPKGRLKAVLKLRKQGMKYVEIADKLNITLANVEYDMRRARGLGAIGRHNSDSYSIAHYIFDGEPLGTFSDVLRCMSGDQVRSICAEAQDSGIMLSEHVGALLCEAVNRRMKKDLRRIIETLNPSSTPRFGQ
jgi:hypothetical protein